MRHTKALRNITEVEVPMPVIVAIVLFATFFSHWIVNYQNTGGYILNGVYALSDDLDTYNGIYHNFYQLDFNFTAWYGDIKIYIASDVQRPTIVLRRVYAALERVKRPYLEGVSEIYIAEGYVYDEDIDKPLRGAYLNTDAIFLKNQPKIEETLCHELFHHRIRAISRYSASEEIEEALASDFGNRMVCINLA